MAETFFSAIEPSKEIKAVSATPPMFDPSGEATGFIVHVDADGSSYGYVIFDSSEKFGIAEYSYGEHAAQSPLQSAVENAPVLFSGSLEKLFYRIDPFTYGCVDPMTDTCVTNYGEEFDASTRGLSLSLGTGYSSKPSVWEDANVLLDLAMVYRNYNVAAVNSISGYTSFPEATVVQKTGTYACAVSAMLCVCSYYVSTGGLSGLKSDYEYLWEASSTQVDRVSGGIVYGATPRDKSGAGVASYCSARGKTVSSSFVDAAGWSRYKSCIDSKQMAIFSAALAGDPSLGHAMTVVGYMTVVDKSDVTSFMNTLMVFDGWRSGLRILNHNASHYSRHDGTFFTG